MRLFSHKCKGCAETIPDQAKLWHLFANTVNLR